MDFLKDKFKLFILFLFFYLSILNFYQLSEQHWSSMLDQDIVMIYNSLLISSGYEQEYRDHPAYTSFLLLGGTFKFLSIFFDNYTIQEIFKSENIDENFQTLFIIGRILNSIYIFLIAFVLLVILKELNIKRNISFFVVFLVIIFQDTYELLFLIRSEGLSILMVLSFLYFLIKFIKEKKIKYSIISGFFVCLAMLAKIHVIFLLCTFIISLPYFVNYLKISKINLVYKQNYYILSIIFLSLLLISYVYFQIVLGDTYLKVLEDPRYYYTNNIDLIFILLFVIIYSFFIGYLSKKKIINLQEIIICISSMLVGFVLCVSFVIFLDLINLIPFNKLNLLRLTNPMEYMTDHAKIFPNYKNIFTTIKYLIFGFGGILELNFNEFLEIPRIFYLDPRTFFRSLQMIFLICLIYFSVISIKNKKINYLSVTLFLGIFIQYLVFNLRETHGYNMYLFPLYVIIASIIFNRLKKKLFIFFYLCLATIFISENLVLSDIHKNTFSREPRVYDICKYENIDTARWKNSDNYLKNYNKSSFIKLVEYPKQWFITYAKQIVPTFINEDGKLKIKESEDFFLEKYCKQIKKEKDQRSISYKLKP